MTGPARKVKDWVRQALGVQGLALEVSELRGRLDQVEADLWNPPHTAEGRSLVQDEGSPSARFAYDDGRASPDSSYAGFEDVFRGSEAFIRERLSTYLPLFPVDGEAVDLGCGRGEMLEVLRENGRRARGVDLDPGMVQRCERAGHTVALAEAGDYLQAQAAATLDVVFSAQFIEHIELDSLLSLLTAARHALKPGGLFVAETVNPHSVSALRTFWVDLTHVKPIFPETLLVLCREAGFPAAEIMFPNGTGDFDRDRRHCGEYAVVAHQAA